MKGIINAFYQWLKGIDTSLKPYFQLSGNYIAETKIASSIAIAAGAEVAIASAISTNCSYISLGVHDLTEDGQVTLRVWPLVAGGEVTQTAGGAVDALSSVYLGNLRAVSTPFRPKSLLATIRLKNERSGSNTYDIYIYRHYEAKP